MKTISKVRKEAKHYINSSQILIIRNINRIKMKRIVMILKVKIKNRINMNSTFQKNI